MRIGRRVGVWRVRDFRVCRRVHNRTRVGVFCSCDANITAMSANTRLSANVSTMLPIVFDAGPTL